MLYYPLIIHEEEHHLLTEMIPYILKADEVYKEIDEEEKETLRRLVEVMNSKYMKESEEYWNWVENNPPYRT